MLQRDNDTIVARVSPRVFQLEGILSSLVGVIKRIAAEKRCARADLIIHPAGRIVLASELRAAFPKLPAVPLDRTIGFGPQRQKRLQPRSNCDLSGRGASWRVLANQTLPRVVRKRIRINGLAQELPQSFIVTEEEQFVAL